MKKVLFTFVIMLLTIAIVCTPFAIAEGSMNIVVRGVDGFDGYISCMQVWKGQLLFLNSGSLYSWSPETHESSEILTMTSSITC